MEKLSSIIRKPGVRKPGVRKEAFAPRMREVLAEVAPVVIGGLRHVAPPARRPEPEAPAPAPARDAPEPVQIWKMIGENAPALIGAVLDGEISESEAHDLLDRATAAAHEIIRDTYARRKP